MNSYSGGAPRGLTPWFETAAGQIFNSMATVVIAANNAPYKQKISADIVCDGVSDEVEVRAAIASAHAAGGGYVQLTEGDFNFSTNMANVSGLSNVVIAGRGPNTVVKGTNLGSGNPLALFAYSSISGLIIRDIKFDANGNFQYGGVKLQGGSRIWIENCDYVDDNPTAIGATDRYGFTFTSNTHTDLWFTNNRMNGPQPEFNTIQNAVISSNTFKNSIQTAVCPINAVATNQTIKYIMFENNFVIVDDAAVLDTKDILGVEIAVDANTLSGTTSQYISVKNNTFRYTTNGGAAVLIGTTSTGTPGGATKPVIADIEVENNNITYEGAENPGVWNSAISVNNGSVSAYDIDRLTIKNNVVRGNAGTVGIGINTVDHMEVSDNVVHGCTTGYNFVAMKDSRMVDNSAVNCITTGFAYNSTRGGNIFRDNDVYGSSAPSNDYVFTNSSATDKIVPFTPSAPTADLEDVTNQYVFANSVTQSLQGSTLDITGIMTHGAILDGDNDFLTIMRRVRKIDITDNVAEEIFTISTANGESGSYSAWIYSMVTNGHGSGNGLTSTQSGLHVLTRAQDVVDGTFILEPVFAGTPKDSDAASGAIDSVTVAAVETDEDTLSVTFQTNISGSNVTFGAGTARIRVFCWIVLHHFNFETDPVITAS